MKESLSSKKGNGSKLEPSQLSGELSPDAALELFAYEIEQATKVLLEWLLIFQNTTSEFRQNQAIPQLYDIVVRYYDHILSTDKYLETQYNKLEKQESDIILQEKFQSHWQANDLLSMTANELRNPFHIAKRSIELYQQQIMSFGILQKQITTLYKEFRRLNEVVICIKNYNKIWHASGRKKRLKTNVKQLWSTEQALVHFLLLLLRIVSYIQHDLVAMQKSVNEDMPTDIFKSFTDFEKAGNLDELETLINEYQDLQVTTNIHKDRNDRILSPAEISKKLVQHLNDLLNLFYRWQQTLEVNFQANNWRAKVEELNILVQDMYDTWITANTRLEIWLDNRDV
ncbi:MAG: hypothetical protein GY797_29530 [Deltaproteobacteria bacterium]|nr:hypothetical protein [Deltaproteobacteria bacterium]